MNLAHPTRKQPDLHGEPLLAIENLHVHYGGIEALKGVSLHVNAGEIVALVGANGAGKSTTLKAVARLVPSSGKLRYAARDLASLSAEAAALAGIALVPEGRAIFPNLTVRENLELGAYGHRDAKAMKETEQGVVALFPRLGERMQQSGQTLSGGEQQMLAIGRALMARPSLLLLDEPSLGIAPKLTELIFEAISAIARSGMTILLVEQNTRVALGVSARAYVLRAGENAMEGSSEDLAKRDDVRAAYLGG
ncbi:MAG: ABC transporter ATP-binding protein [Polyangiaceae bacterium]